MTKGPMATQTVKMTAEEGRHHTACERAGCGHPFFYDFDDGQPVFGWCALCRAVELGADNAIWVELMWLHAS
jgi:hypothetical protein